MARIRRDWDPLVEKLIGKTEKQNNKQRKELRDSLISITPIFSQKPYFMSDEFTLIDCVLAPTLWRFGEFHIDIPESAQPLIDYADRLFNRESFKESLSEVEEDMISFNQHLLV